MSYALKRAKHKHKQPEKKCTFILCINEVKFTVPVTAKNPGKVLY